MIGCVCVGVVKVVSVVFFLIVRMVRLVLKKFLELYGMVIEY